MAASLGPLYSVSLDGFEGKTDNLEGRWRSLQVEVELREPQTFYRSAPSSKLEETNLCTETSLSHAHPGPVDAATNSE